MIASDLIINDNDNDNDDDDDDNNDRVISRLYLSFDDSNNDNDISFDDSNDDDDDDDDDDDINVKRRRRHKNNDNIIVITLHHYRLTSLQNVGLQIWRASLLLSDYLLYLYHDKSNRVNDNKVIIELGCGVGLLSIITGIINDKTSSSSSSSSSRIEKAYFTDWEKTIVELSENNATVNSHIIKNSTSDINFRILDWSIFGFPIKKTGSNSDNDDSKYLWTNDDVNYLLHNDVIYFAADIVYDDTITLNFMTKLNELLKNGIDKCYIALEKRFNFSIDCMDVVANGYDYFLSFLNIDDNNDTNNDNNDTNNDNNGTNNDNTNDDNHIKLYAKRLDINFPQYILNYNRGNDLELYIVYKK